MTPWWSLMIFDDDHHWWWWWSSIDHHLTCHGYSFSSVWTPPTIFNTRFALPHLIVIYWYIIWMGRGKLRALPSGRLPNQVMRVKFQTLPKIRETSNTMYPQNSPTLEHWIENWEWPAICRGHCRSTCRLGSCTGTVACAVSIVARYMVPRTLIANFHRLLPASKHHVT